MPFRTVTGPIPLKAKASSTPVAIDGLGFSAIGQCLKDQYDALASPLPRHLAALIEQLEKQR
jgi:hypothetical protein